MKLHTIPKTLGLISMLFATSLATASPGTKMTDRGMHMECDNMSMMSGDMKIDPVARAQKHLGELKAKLALTADQQPAWQAFANQVNAQAQTMATMRAKMQADTDSMPKTAPEQMARMADRMKEGAQNMAKMAVAVKTFYDTLKPDQQAALDKFHASHMKQMK